MQDQTWLPLAIVLPRCLLLLGLFQAASCAAVVSSLSAANHNGSGVAEGLQPKGGAGGFPVESLTEHELGYEGGVEGCVRFGEVG